MKERVGIVFGGNSVEHEISILSMIQVNYAIDKEKYDIRLIYITKDGRFLVGPNFDKLDTFKKDNFKCYEVMFYRKNNKLRLKGIGFVPKKYLGNIDVILPVVHGKGVEDGTLAGFFNMFNIPYAASNILSASIAQNKTVSKILLERTDVSVVPSYSFTHKQWNDDVFKILEKCLEMEFPLIIKPAKLGSSIGIHLANDQDELIKAINYAIKFDDLIIVEKKLVDFREFNQAILGDIEEYKLSEIEEVITESTYLTFDDKYTTDTIKRQLPANISDEIKNKIIETSKKVITCFDTMGVVRIDYLYDVSTNELFVNEINSIPGSLAYYLFEEQISFTELIDYMIKKAIKAHYYQNLKIGSFKSNVLNTNHLNKK